MRLASSLVGIMLMMAGITSGETSSTAGQGQKRLYTAYLVAEIHTFSPFLTAFEDFGRVEAGAEDPGPLLGMVKATAAGRGWKTVQGPSYGAEPAGRIVRSAYDTIKTDILDGLRAAMPVDAVVLLLHGAIVAEGVDDGEGDILRAVREIVGPDIPVGVGLDGHAHLSDAMVEYADVMVFMKEWPHIDVPQTVEDATDLTIDAAEGTIEPHMAVFDLRMIAPFHTLIEPMKPVIDDMKAAEGTNGVLSVSLIHGFAHADVPDMGSKVLVITDNRPEVGAKLAKDFGERIFALRGRTHAPYLTLEEGVEAIKASSEAPIVVADMGDITGGGAMGDATYVLQAFIENGIDNAAIAYIWDAFAASTACKAGKGATLRMRIGGKASEYSGEPLDLDVEVVGAYPESSYEDVDGSTGSMGDVAVVRAHGIDVVLNSVRTTALSYHRFEDVGIDPLSKKVLVVKSANNFYAGFEEIAAEVLYLDTPGLTGGDITELPFTKIRRPKWPFDENPFAEGSGEKPTVFIAGMAHETNTFSPIPTNLQSFRDVLYYSPDTARDNFDVTEVMGIQGFAEAFASLGYEAVFGPVAFAAPGGPMVQKDYETLRDDILAHLKKAGAVDAVALFLHGAQMAEGYDDCEGDLVRRVREIVGPGVPIGVLLDLHCDATTDLVDNATVVMACKEYPHTDFDDRAKEIAGLLDRSRKNEIHPVMTLRHIPMISFFHTTGEPMRGLVGDLVELEHDEILSISLMHGFPWSDSPYAGAYVLVVSDGAGDKAQRLAEQLVRRWTPMRGSSAGKFVDVETALDRAAAANAGPVVVADVADNPGGGAAADATFILREILDRGLKNVALAAFWDPVAVDIARAAGQGASLDLRIGGKVSPLSGDPVDLRVTIGAIVAEPNPTSPGRDEVYIAVEAEGVYLVLTNQRAQVTSPEVFSQLGIDPESMDIVVVKSSQHFRAGFEPIATEIIYCDTPGTLNSNIADVAFTRVPRPIWPLDDIAEGEF